MPLCLKCQRWSDHALVGDACHDCFKFLGFNVDKMTHLFSGTNPPPAPSTALNNLPPPHTLPSAQNSQINTTTAPSHNHSTTILNTRATQSTLNVLKPPSNLPAPFPSHPNVTTSVPTIDSGSMAHFRRIVKEKRVKPTSSGPSSKQAKPSVTMPTPPAPANLIKHRDFGFHLYESDILVKNTGIHQIKQPYDLDNPNLYNDLCTSLWAMFSPQILTKTHFTSLPSNPKDYLCLSDGESRIPDQETLLGTVIACGNKSLASKMELLSKPMPSYLHINTDSWILAQRLLLDNIETTKATTESIIIKVNKREVIGSGGIHEVEIITDYVAKVMKDIQHQSLKLHAANARMYEACAVLLEEYLSVIEACQGLPMNTKAKAKQMQIIRHSVVFTGDIFCPTDIYFFEKHLPGKYVKYSSNTDFNITVDQIRMDPKVFQLMNTFTHWTYNISNGKNLVADLQGVGPHITDPQIIDLDESLWTLGNNSADGIKAFI
ncbi:alphaK I10 [Puccinia graminis f. sp. tritici CRL 75-36-700-3]|uniref:AlphaK I10 n=1 Tax=Puccinia graminis f. sp. tritici (strain CRL 75-36-700-3 / race SCCL) TaxID=418459 RepID=E3JZY0_PUCGT|nr:alphaK I10 [Puccinia graminis f. sp. tritici CRL 75-36-700-3]EFP77605.1 alphaK I10 [Puccinia graminis f. sp. tritici CRL 75-36-700-3]